MSVGDGGWCSDSRRAGDGKRPIPERLQPSQPDFNELLIIHLVLNWPRIYIHEIQKELAETTGTAISVPNSLHKSGFSWKKLSPMVLQRSENTGDQFRSAISIYKPPWLVFIDENGTDRRDAIFVGLGIAYEANQRRPTG